MIRSALTILAFFLVSPTWAQPGASGTPPQQDQFAAELVTAVFSTALEFIAPRALEVVSIQQLAIWGLRGITTLDASLTPSVVDGVVSLRRGSTTLFQRPTPSPNSPDGWGQLISDITATAWTNSMSIQAGGTQGVITTIFEEMFNHLDPYSRYVAPEKADEDRARRSGEAGAGLLLTQTPRGFLVQTVNADGPAAEAGIVAGDAIVAVDDQPTRGETLDTILDWITGVEGSDVTLTVRTRAGRVRRVELERVVLPPETVFGSRVGDYILLRISGFSSDTDQRFGRELARQLGRVGGASLRGIVVDLRGNRGGLLRQAVAATDILLASGIIATTAGRDPQAAHEWHAEQTDLAAGKPVVVLVDGRTASAAEIMAGALAGQGRAVVVGSSTLGKGLVQTIATLPDGGELFVSWSRVLAPGGWPYQALGILPQVCTSLGRDQVADQLTALDKGTLRLRAALQQRRAARAPVPAAEVVEQRAVCPAAEGKDQDIAVARYLFSHPVAYSAALLTPAGD